MRALLPRFLFGCRWLALLPLACCVSCSGAGGLHPVEGKVLHNNQPLKGVLVTFHPEIDDMNTVRPLGLTKEDGTFTVKTGDNEGAPAGKYTLTFICSEEVPRPKGAAMSTVMGPEYADRFKGAYLDKAASKFQIEIAPGPNKLEAFELK